MTTYCLELRNTQQWDDVRYRSYTSSAKKAEAFKAIPKLQFTDSGHGMVSHVTERKPFSGKKEPTVFLLKDYVDKHMNVAVTPLAK